MNTPPETTAGARPRESAAARGRSEREQSRSAPPARLVLAAALLASIAFLALRRSPYVDSVPWIPHWLGGWADRHGVVRNVVAFFGLGLACAVLLGLRVRLFVWLAVFGTAIEVAQIWIPGRTFDLRDIAATLAGLALAWLAAWSARGAARLGATRTSGP